MFLPIGTDAPIYHRPYATLALIAANVMAFVTTHGGDTSTGWLLTFGNGLHPTEWVKSAFLHFGIAHLVGNLIFLFLFGLIIEGKLGAFRFSLLYLTLCLLDGMAGQLLMLNYTGPGTGAGGASGVIFALMAIAWLWAPQNCIEVMFLFNYHFINTFEVTVQTAALYYIGINLLFAWLWGFEVSTPVLHLLGAGVGFGVGLFLLKQEWVDCEGWDLISLRGGDHPVQNRNAPINRTAREDTENQIRQVELQITRGQFNEAWWGYAAVRDAVCPQWLPQRQLEKLLQGLVRLGNWIAAVELLKEFLERFDQDKLRHQLALASILTRQLQRPRAALKVLKVITPHELDQRSLQRFAQIRQDAMRQIDDGVLEIQVP